MRVAFLSDVHGNLDALRRVRDDIADQGVDRTMCLGDVVSYNADQRACMEWIGSERWQWVAGNHDLIAAGVLEPINCGASARYAASKARRELPAEWRDHIKGLPLLVREEEFVAFHASPRRVDEYVHTERAALEAFGFMCRATMPPLAFFGHTHRDCVWSLIAGRLHRRTGERLNLEPHGMHLVNVGTVGEPRDGGDRATYVIFDSSDDSVEFRRLAYDCRSARRRAEAGGWRRRDGPSLLRFYDRVRRAAGRLRHRVLPLPRDDSSLEALERRMLPTGMRAQPLKDVSSRPSPRSFRVMQARARGNSTGSSD